jgi:lysozyme family protein/peptidoglycan hydrolase-like protein with peptidoglycan-binding domain
MQEEPRHVGGLTSQERLGNGALLGQTGLESASSEAIQDDEIGVWMGTADEDTDMGPPDAELMGASPLPPDDGGGRPPPNGADIAGPLEGPSGQIEAVHAEAAALQGAMSAMPSWDGGGEMGGFGEFSGLEQFGLGVSSVADQADAQIQKYKTVEEELIANMVLGMSIDEKQSTLSEMGYSTESIGQMSASMMDQALMGTLNSQVRFLRIQGMSPDELRHLSIGDQRQFLTDLGVPAKDLRKAKDRYIRSAVSDVVAKSKVPGRHTVRLKIKGGFFRKKSYNIQLDVNDEGHLAGVDIKKKGGFFSKLGGFIKMALPFIAKLLAGVTGGLSLVALGIYNAVQAARQGNWLGAIAAAAGGLAGASLGMVAKVADKVAQIAQSTQAGLLAIKAKSPGGLLAAISSGAGAVAGFAADQASKFATTLKGWSDKLATAGNIATGTEATVAAIRGKDPLAAVSGALAVMGSVAEAKTPGSSKGGHLERAQSVSRHVRLARSAIGSKPPQYGVLADAVLKMAGEFNSSGKIDSASRLARTGQALHNAVISGDPSRIANAVVDVAEAIELANGGEDGLEADRRTAVGDKYRKTRAVVRPSMGVVEGLRSGDWESALRSSAVLVETLNEKGLAGSAATVARLSLAMKGAILSGDAERMYNAASALGSAVQHVWVEVRTKEEEEAQAPVPLDVLPSTPINIEMGLVVTLPSRPIKLAAASLPSASSSSSSDEMWEYECGDGGFEARPAPPVHRVTTSQVSLAQRHLNEWSTRFHQGITLDVDGALGASTRSAIEQYQRAYGLKETGEINAATRRSLNRMSISIAYEAMTNPAVFRSPEMGDQQSTEPAIVGPPPPEQLALSDYSKCVSAADCTGGVPGDSAYLKQVLHNYYAMEGMEIQLSPRQMADVRAFRAHFEQHSGRYDAVARATDVPAKLIAALHWRESGARAGSFDTYLHQGDPLGRPAVHWPTDIPVFEVGQWDEAAIHALNGKNTSMPGLLHGLDMNEGTDDAVTMATYAEFWNGLGYSQRGLNSPYVFGATNKQQDGKFTKDHADGFDPAHRDQQIGVLPLLGALGGMTSPVDLSPVEQDPALAWSEFKENGSLWRKGDGGAVVTALQSKLAELGYAVTVDGQFGGQTEQALQAFQAQQPGLFADGVLGSGTADRIDAALEGDLAVEPAIAGAPLGPVARLFQRISDTENPALDDVSIDRDQLRAYLEDDLQFAQGEWFRGKKLNGAVDSLMEQLDLNGDGRVSWAEFQAITDQLAAVLVPGSVAKLTGAETIQAATEYFDSIPGASDGSISFEDLKQVAHDSLPEFTDHRGLVAQLIARLAIDTIDSNQRALEVEDRTISREEWIQAVIEIVNGGQ